MTTIDYTQYVNTNIGTIGHLLKATSPSVQSPHGCAIINPVFRPGLNDFYLSDKIFGFTVGCATIMPTVSANTPDFDETASTFDHDFETARPDFYAVLLEESGITARHTANKNYGVFEYTFPDAENAHVVIYTNSELQIEQENGRIYLLSGKCKTARGLLDMMLDVSDATDISLHTAIVPQNGYPFAPEECRAILITYRKKVVSIPFVLSTAGKQTLDECYQTEVTGKSFADVKAECNAAWNNVLGKIRIQGGTEAQKTVFYTAVYRATSRMHNYSVCGKYKGFDGNIHDDCGHGYYCDDGIWDTYRGMHPLQLLIEPEAHRDTLISYLRMYQQSGWLPRFPYLSGNVPCMLGHHTVSILAESMVKGVELDYNLAYEAAYKNATKRTMLPWRDGEADELTRCYYEKGFFPALEEDEEETCDLVHPFENRQAVAVTIEHSYDDWCLARMAEGLGKTEDAAYFDERSGNYKKLYNKQTGFVHPRKIDGSFTKIYNPKYCGGQGGRRYFAENNAYIYNFAAQHDIEGTIEMMGGKEAFAAKLDNLFVEQYDMQLKSNFLYQFPDATGLMGQFCMGNEPSFHIPYLYNHCGQAYKTQRKIHELIDLWFTNTPLGICGDEDGGAMSAFLAFSAMGFYPVNPASGEYDLGSPIFDRIEIDLPNGKTFAIAADGAAQKKKYIQSATLNGEVLTAPKFSHEQMMAGGELTLTMGARPNKDLFC